MTCHAKQSKLNMNTSFDLNDSNLSNEFSRIGNLPAFNGIQALQQQITALSVAIQNGFQGTTQQHNALLARVQLMDVKAAARYVAS
jgi:hypothetical protein